HGMPAPPRLSRVFRWPDARPGTVGGSWRTIRSPPRHREIRTGLVPRSPDLRAWESAWSRTRSARSLRIQVSGAGVPDTRSPNRLPPFACLPSDVTFYDYN